MTSKHPQIKWAETDKAVFITILVPNCTDEKITVEGDTLNFSGTNSDGNYACALKLKGEVDGTHKDSKYGVKARFVDFHLIKKEAERWNTLLADKKLGKAFVKADWDKWIDEEDEAEGKGFNTEGMNAGLGGMPGMGMPGMPGMGMPGMPGMGMPGMPGMGMPGMPGMPGMGNGGGSADIAKMMEQLKAMQKNDPKQSEAAVPQAQQDSDDDDELPDLESTD